MTYMYTTLATNFVLQYDIITWLSVACVVLLAGCSCSDTKSRSDTCTTWESRLLGCSEVRSGTLNYLAQLLHEASMMCYSSAG